MMPAMAARARTIFTGGEPSAWARLGFSVQEDGSAPVGGLRLVAGGSELRVEAAGPEEERPDELAIAGTADAFHRLGPLVLEVVATGAAPALWGLVVVVADLDACARDLGPLLGSVKPAVQPGRRIATVRSEAGLPVALALMTPQPPRVSAVGD
jgi:hypothetical protein